MIIFAGPHKAFTTGNNGLQTEISHAVFSTHQDIEREGDLREEVKQVHFSIPMHEKLGLVVDPYASSKEDYLELGRTASSWQEARKQQFIENCIKIPVDEKRLIQSHPTTDQSHPTTDSVNMSPATGRADHNIR